MRGRVILTKTTLALVFDITMMIASFILAILFFMKGFDIYLILIPSATIFSSAIALYMDLKKRKSDSQK